MRALLLCLVALAALAGVAPTPTWWAANVTAGTAPVGSFTPVCMNLVSAWHALRSPRALGPPVWVALTNELYQPVVVSWVDAKGVEHPRTVIGSRCTAWFLAAADQVWRARPLDPSTPPGPCDPSGGYMLNPAAVVSAVLLPKPPVTQAAAEFIVKAPAPVAAAAGRGKQASSNASTLLDGPAGNGHWVWVGLLSPCPGEAQRHHEGADRLGSGSSEQQSPPAGAQAGSGLQAASGAAAAAGPSTLRPARLHPSLDAFSLSAVQGSISRRGFYACREELGPRDVSKGCMVRTGGAVRAELDLSYKTLVGAVAVDQDAGLTMVVRLPIQALMEPTVRKAVFNRTVPCPVCTAGLNVSSATGVVTAPDGATRCERCFGTGTISNVTGVPLQLPAVKKAGSKGHRHHHHAHAHGEGEEDEEDDAAHASPPLNVLAAGYQVTKVCPKCLGWGYRTHTHCSRCEDTGIVEHLMVHDVVVPAGAPSEWMSMWPGLGGEKPFKKPGNLVAALDAFNLTLLRVGAMPFHEAPSALVASLQEAEEGNGAGTWTPPQPSDGSDASQPPPPQSPVEGTVPSTESSGDAPAADAAAPQPDSPAPGDAPGAAATPPPVPLEPMPGYRGAALLRTLLDVDPQFRNGTFGPHIVALLQLSLFQATRGFVTEWELPSGQVVRLDRRGDDLTTPPWQVYVVPGAGLPVWFPACNWSTPCSVPEDADSRMDGKLCANTTDAQLKGLLTASCPDYAPAWQALYADYARCESGLGYNASVRPSAAIELYPAFAPPTPTPLPAGLSAAEAPTVSASDVLELTPGGEAAAADSAMPAVVLGAGNVTSAASNATALGADNATASNATTGLEMPHGSTNSSSDDNDSSQAVAPTPRPAPPRTPAPEDRVTFLCAPSPRRAVHYYPHGHLFIVVRVLLPLMPGQTPGSTEELTDEEKVAVRGSITRWADHQRAEAAAAAAAAATAGLDEDEEGDGSMTPGADDDDAAAAKDGDAATSTEGKKGRKQRRLSRRRASRRRRRFTGRRKKAAPSTAPEGLPHSKSSRGKKAGSGSAAAAAASEGSATDDDQLADDAAVVEDDDGAGEDATDAAAEAQEDVDGAGIEAGAATEAQQPAADTPPAAATVQ